MKVYTHGEVPSKATARHVPEVRSEGVSLVTPLPEPYLYWNNGMHGMLPQPTYTQSARTRASPARGVVADEAGAPFSQAFDLKPLAEPRYAEGSDKPERTSSIIVAVMYLQVQQQGFQGFRGRQSPQFRWVDEDPMLDVSPAPPSRVHHWRPCAQRCCPARCVALD